MNTLTIPNNTKLVSFKPFDEFTKTLNLIEYVNTDVLDQIYCNNKIYKQDRNKYFNMLNSVEDNVLNVSYTQKEYNGNKYGRYYPVNKSMCGTYMWRRARATLYGSDEFDIDMKTAHQSIAEMIITKYYSAEYFNTTYPMLKKYIYDRENVIPLFDIKDFDKIIKNYNDINICDYTKKDIVKCFHTTEMYGGNVDTWLNTFDIEYDNLSDDLKKYITDYEKENKKLTEDILKLSVFETLINDFDEQRKKEGMNEKPNRDGSALALILQNEEAKITIEAIKFVNQFKDIIPTVYAYDGFQIRSSLHKSDAALDELDKMLNTLNKHINIKFNSNNIIQFINKPFSEPFSASELNDIDYECKYLLPYFLYTNCDQLSRYISYVINDNVIMNDDGCYFYNSKFWELKNKEEIVAKYDHLIYNSVKTSVLTYLPGSDAKMKKYQTAIINYTSNTMMDKAFKKALSSKITKVMFDDRFELLNCNNGTINLDTFELQPHNPKDLCSKFIKFDAPVEEVDGKKIIPKVKYDDVITEFLHWFDDGIVTKEEAKELVNYLLYCFGQSLHGNNFMEKAILLLGKLSRNGKTTTMDLLQKVLNNYMVGLNLCYFTTYDHKSNEPHPELLALKGARIVRVDEAGGEENKLIPDKFKTLIGGDDIRVRDLYKGKDNIVVFKNSAIFYFLSNFQLQFTTEGNDTSGKLLFFEFNCLFANDSFPGWNNKTNPNHKMMKESYKNDLLNNNVFLNHLFATILAFAQEKMEAPEIHKIKNKKNLTEVNSVSAWCDDNLIYDEKHIYFDENDWLIKKDKIPSLTKAFKKCAAKGEKLEKQLTLDFLYDRYKKECENPVSKRNFNNVVSLKYKDSMSDKTTRYFGGQKKYIAKWSLKADIEDIKDDKADKLDEKPDDDVYVPVVPIKADSIYSI